MDERVDLNIPRWNQAHYSGRVRYFFATTNPLNILKSNFELMKCKQIVTDYNNGGNIPDGLTIDDIYKAKIVVDSAFHPDTGEKMNIFGRMSAQVPMNMLITYGMVSFYKSTIALIFWQWFNQSYNALVNYTNRSGNIPISFDQILKSYILTTSAALITAVGLNRLIMNLPPICERFVPFVAAVVAHCINIPLMRIKELQNGIAVYDENKKFLGNSKIASRRGILAVLISRITVSSMGILLTPILMEIIGKSGITANMEWLQELIEMLLCGIIYALAIPISCAIYPQISPISIDKLEPELQDDLYISENGRKFSFEYWILQQRSLITVSQIYKCIKIK
ncbi:sideroflexin-1-like isoform X2 [Sipha flava]|uniref:Sidoreflexin n=1 Tax=Sipha flava TaxID=143950 RepID=A0A8B8FNG5_9HEMI|nr:sideroflexin-1-like isoform X2 [Sipha flava]